MEKENSENSNEAYGGVKEVIDKLESLLPEVEAHQLQKGNMGDIFDIQSEIEEGEKLGLKFI